MQSIQPVSSLPELYDSATVTRQFKQDGFTHIFQWTDRPSAEYPAHTHSSVSAHYLLNGEMRVYYPALEQTVVYRAGDRFDVPAKCVHAATVGAQGCTYMVGEK